MKAIATTAHRATRRRASADQSAGRLLTFGMAQVVVERKARYRTSGPQHLHPVAETESAVAQAERAAVRGICVCQGIVAGPTRRWPEGRRGSAPVQAAPAS